MTDRVLTVIDTIGVQSYIFSSNRLLENIGASELVEQATHQWVAEALEGRGHNLTLGLTIDSTRTLEEDPSLDVEVVLLGGGNAVLLSRTMEAARDAVRRLSRLALIRAPGLEIVAAHRPFTWADTALGGEQGVYQKTFEDLAGAKQQRPGSAALGSLSVALECRSTGLPAVGFYRKEASRPISAEIAAKLDKQVLERAEGRLQQMFSDVTAGYGFRRDFDELGRSHGEQSYIAVVHADGNGMGVRFRRQLVEHEGSNRELITALRTLSEAVAAAGQRSVRRVITQMVAAFQAPADRELQRLLASLTASSEGAVLPFRPLVFGGDDVTFVCDGRLGLWLAAHYLTAWEEETSTDPVLGRSFACAGVAVVKTHYPFVRAYELSADLCASAKARVRGLAGASALDWHFALSGISGEIGQIREREYTVPEGSLTLRPVLLRAEGPESWRSWPTIERHITQFQNGSIARNKVKQLREVLRSGSDAVRRYRASALIGELPDLNGDALFRATGWSNGRCGYFDTIEATDFYLQLSGEGN